MLIRLLPLLIFIIPFCFKFKVLAASGSPTLVVNNPSELVSEDDVAMILSQIFDADDDPDNYRYQDIYEVFAHFCKPSADVYTLETSVPGCGENSKSNDYCIFANIETNCDFKSQGTNSKGKFFTDIACQKGPQGCKGINFKQCVLERKLILTEPESKENPFLPENEAINTNRSKRDGVSDD